MLRFVSSELRHRPGRPLALAAGTLVAAVAFVLLASAAKTSSLRVHGSVKSNFRNAYDILVRPRGSFSQLERRARLVRDNYLAGIFGGISLRQYHTILGIRGVEVAAPIANIGYILPFGQVPIPIGGLLNQDPVQLYRLRLSWAANGGLSRYPGPDQYVYYTRRDPIVFTWLSGFGFRFPSDLQEVVPGHGKLQVCSGFAESQPEAKGPFDLRPESGLTCFSQRTPGSWWVNFYQAKARHVAPGIGAEVSGFFPILLAAIDPLQEARLLHLDRTVVSGHYLGEHQAPTVRFVDRTDRARFVPVIASTRTYVDETLEAKVERLRIPTGADVPAILASGGCEKHPATTDCVDIEHPHSPSRIDAYPFLRSLRGTVVGTRQIPMQTVYSRDVLSGGRARGLNETSSDSYWTPSDVRYRRLGVDELAPRKVQNPLSIWRDTFYRSGYYEAPQEARDVQFRLLKPHPASHNFIGNVVAAPSFQIVGRYDPRKLPGFSPLSKVPLETYYPPELDPADAASRQALHNRPLLPTQNLGDYIEQPPLMLTTLASLPVLTNSQYFAGANAKAPISVIRVRVSGVKGPDPLSIARIKAVALQIHERTGLDVDITAGSSPHPLTIHLPAGRFGRPPLLLTEGWVKKGVSVSFLKAVDRKDVALFALIPIVCALFLGNAALAVVRGRRAEIGTLLTLGWSRRAIFGAVLGELALIGLVAGLAGAGLSALLVSALSLQAALWRTLLVIPLSVVLAVAAGLVAAARAAAGSPLDSVRPAVAGEPGRGRAHGFASLALLNLRRLPWRAAVALAGLVLGVAALTILLGVERGFQGTLVGTLLGKAISIQISGYDFLSAGLTIGLAASSLADVLLTNLRERSAELVTLRTVGWADRHLARVIALEALALGLAGSLTGALLGLAVATAIGASLGPLVPFALLAAAGGIAVALLASLVPLATLPRLQPAVVFAEAE